MNKFLTRCAISTVLLILGSRVSAQEIIREGNFLTKLGVQGYFPTVRENVKDPLGKVIIKDENGKFSKINLKML